MIHPADETLAALRDGGLVEDEARAVRAHVDGCERCRAELAAFERLVGRVSTLPEAGEAERMAQRAMGAKPRRRSSAIAAGVALAAAAALVVTLQPDEDEFRARGDAHPRAVHAQVFRVDGETPVRLADGDRAVGLQSLSVSVSTLGAEPSSAFACVARDAGGRVTWLLPAWPGGEPPALRALDDAPAAFGGEQRIELPALPAGPLEIWSLVTDGVLDARTLDGKLEAGWVPEVGQGGVRAVERVVVFAGDS